jgi:hypothetical protein
MSKLRAVAIFWYDFIVGDDSGVALAVVVAPYTSRAGVLVQVAQLDQLDFVSSSSPSVK